MSRIGDLYIQNKLINDVILEKKRMEAITLQKLQKPSDNPFDSERVIINHSKIRYIEQFKKNITFTKPILNFSSKVLDNIFNDILSRARTIAVRADSIRLNSESNALAMEVRNLKLKLLDYANSKYYGNYIFSGTDVYNKPFTFAYSEVKTSYAYNNIYNNTVVSHNTLSDPQSKALSAGEKFSFRHGDNVIYIKAIKDMTLEELTNKINDIASKNNIPIIARIVQDGTGYKLYITSGDNVKLSDINFGTELGNPTLENDYPYVVLTEGHSVSVDIKNIKTNATTTISVSAGTGEAFSLAELRDKFNEEFRKNGINASAVIRKTQNNKFYLSFITGDPDLRFTNINDTGGKLVNSSTPTNLLISNEDYGKVIYFGNYIEKDIDIDENRAVKGNKVIADEVAQTWKALSILEAAIYQRTTDAHFRVVSKNTANLSDTVLNSGDQISIDVSGKTYTYQADSNKTLEQLITDLNNFFKANNIDTVLKADYLYDENTGLYKFQLQSIDPTKPISLSDINVSSSNTFWSSGLDYASNPINFVSVSMNLIDKNMQNLNTKRIELGQDLEFIDFIENKLDNQKVETSKVTDELENVKLEQALTEMSKFQSIYQMNLMLLSKSSKLSLLDFMR